MRNINYNIIDTVHIYILHSRSLIIEKQVLSQRDNNWWHERFHFCPKPEF